MTYSKYWCEFCGEYHELHYTCTQEKRATAFLKDASEEIKRREGRLNKIALWASRNELDLSISAAEQAVEDARTIKF